MTKSQLNKKLAAENQCKNLFGLARESQLPGGRHYGGRGWAGGKGPPTFPVPSSEWKQLGAPSGLGFSLNELVNLS